MILSQHVWSTCTHYIWYILFFHTLFFNFVEWPVDIESYRFPLCNTHLRHLFETSANPLRRKAHLKFNKPGLSQLYTRLSCFKLYKVSFSVKCNVWVWKVFFFSLSFEAKISAALFGNLRPLIRSFNLARLNFCGSFWLSNTLGVKICLTPHNNITTIFSETSSTNSWLSRPINFGTGMWLVCSTSNIVVSIWVLLTMFIFHSEACSLDKAKEVICLVANTLSTPFYMEKIKTLIKATWKYFFLNFIKCYHPNI